MPSPHAWNQLRYRLYEPVYDWIARPLEHGRRRAIELVEPAPHERVLLVGCGTGLGLEYLPRDASVTAVDATPAMVRRTAARATRLDRDVSVQLADAQRLPFRDDAFDVVTLHLLLSVVPDPAAALSEAARVLAPDGRVSIYDKFVEAGSEPSLLRRAVNPAARFLFADLNRRLEPMLDGTELRVHNREQFLRGLYTATVARPTNGD